MADVMRIRHVLDNLNADQQTDLAMNEIAYETIKEALEKQIPKKPKKVTLDTYDFTTYYVCPTCNTHDRGCKAPYCRWCGQKLDWDE